MSWQTIIAIMLLVYLGAFGLLWSAVRDACALVDTIKQPLDRYERITRKDR